MNKERFIKMLEQANICEDIFKDDDSAEIYDRHFWNDDTLECYVISTKHDEDIEYKEPERIEELDDKYCYPNDILQKKINELVRISNKYARLLEKVESDE